MIAAPACWIEIGLDRESEVALPRACQRQPRLFHESDGMPLRLRDASPPRYALFTCSIETF